MSERVDSLLLIIMSENKSARHTKKQALPSEYADLKVQSLLLLRAFVSTSSNQITHSLGSVRTGFWKHVRSPGTESC